MFDAHVVKRILMRTKSQFTGEEKKVRTTKVMDHDQNREKRKTCQIEEYWELQSERTQQQKVPVSIGGQKEK